MTIFECSVIIQGKLGYKKPQLLRDEGLLKRYQVTLQ